MNKRVYINSMAQVSCQQPLSDDWLSSPCVYSEAYVRAIEPDTKGLIVPSEARRMSKILKRTVCTAITALNNSDVQQPDAIITGTGMGCMENSEKFLIDMSRFGENCLKPTLFMQSTHNTISSLIAIILKCHGYNSTYSHKGISFESALLDAWLQIRRGDISNALTGSHDEVTPFMALVMQRTHPEYSFVSETSMSAVLTSRPGERNICEVASVEILYRPDIDLLADRLADDSALMLGVNGNEANDAPYTQLLELLGHTPALLQYKNIFGENFSSPAMAFYAAATLLGGAAVPQHMLYGATDGCANPETITIVNHSDTNCWSLIRLKKI
ncbi:MAG: beta-ketoacyl synthase chain length factor [Muribaculaceae bacterium]|nr:beta-ketoacyl synthase chain length factor [Muribaculaceae bacterium]